jgi:hypothetical protein
MGTALRIILIIIVAWYIYRVLDRVIGPLLFGSSKQEKTAAGQKEKNFKKTTSQGDVTITDFGKSKKNIKSNDDYIYFEEVD